MVKITKPTETNTNTARKPIHLLLVGMPSSGKSTLACSAPNPIWFDLDDGADRVRAVHRVDRITLDDLNGDYQQLLDFVQSDEIDQYDTAIIDTGKALQEFMRPYLGKISTAYLQSDGTLTQKGYGALKKAYQVLNQTILKTKKKNLITVLHADEKDKGDITVYRPDLEGSMKSEIWRSATLAGLLETRGNKRVLSFKNTEYFTGKANNGVADEYNVPDVSGEKANDFLGKLFDKYYETVEAEQAQSSVLRAEYDKLMGELRPKIDGMTAKTANAVSELIQNAKHIASSKVELGNLFKKKAVELGLTWNGSEWMVVAK